MEIKRLVKIDLLEPVTEPTEWVNSYVTVERIFLILMHIFILKEDIEI